MKKYALACIAAVVTLVSTLVVGCNRDIIDTVYSYDEAIIALPDGEIIKGTVKKWRDYEDGDQIQVEFVNDTIYLAHSSNVTLIKNK